MSKLTITDNRQRKYCKYGNLDAGDIFDICGDICIKTSVPNLSQGIFIAIKLDSGNEVNISSDDEVYPIDAELRVLS